MGLDFLIIFKLFFDGVVGLLPTELVEEQSVTLDDEAVYEAVEDSIIDSVRPILGQKNYRVIFRIRGDSFNANINSYATFFRARICADGKEACLILEKDRGEKGFADFVGGGISYKEGDWRLTAGDFLAYFGTGLLLTTPYARSGLNFSGLPEAERTLLNSAQENRNLRGLRFEWSKKGFKAVVLGSCSYRDARLNSDGTVARLNYSGLHNDSATIAGKNQVAQGLGGLMGYYQIANFITGVYLQGIRFTRAFAPQESTESFFGQNLGGASIFLRGGSNNSLGEVEFARSFPGGMAGMARFTINEAEVNAVLAGAVYQRRFFSPAGRRYALTNREARLELRGKLGYRQGSLKVVITGNTQRDYSIDSIPARGEIRVGYDSRPLALKLILGRTYRSEQERTRTTRVELGTGFGPMKSRLILGDEYPELTIGRGRMVVLNTAVQSKDGEFAFTLGGIAISGEGVRVSIPESGVMRSGSSFSSSSSALRGSLTSAFQLKRLGRISGKVGLTHKKIWTWDFGVQLELN